MLHVSPGAETNEPTFSRLICDRVTQKLLLWSNIFRGFGCFASSIHRLAGSVFGVFGGFNCFASCVFGSINLGSVGCRRDNNSGRSSRNNNFDFRGWRNFGFFFAARGEAE